MARGFYFTSGVGGNDRIIIPYARIPNEFTLSYYARWDYHVDDPNNYDVQCVISHMLSQGHLSFGFNWDGNEAFVPEYSVTGDPSPIFNTIPRGFESGNFDFGNGVFVCVKVNLFDMLDPNKGNPRPKVWMNGDLVGGFWMSNPSATSLPYSGGINKWTLGRGRDRYNNTQRFKGVIAEVSLYEGDRPDEDCVALSQGYTALNFPVDKLAFYMPLETNTIEWVSNTEAEVTGTLQKPHPTVIKPAVEPARPVPPPPPDPANSRTIYSLGNSLSDVWRNITDLAETANKSISFGRHNIPGTPLSGIRTRAAEGFFEEPYGYYTNALVNYNLDAIVAQPYFRELVEANNEGDVYNVNFFIELLATRPYNKQNTTVFIYEQWYRAQETDVKTAASWETGFMRPYAPGTGTTDTKAYYNALLSAVRAESGTKLDKQILLAPVGSAMRLFNQKAASGNVPGYSSAWGLYATETGLQQHMNDTGAYLVSCVMFSCFFNLDPHVLGVPSSYGTIAPAVKTAIHDAVWEAVLADPNSGVSEPIPPSAPTATLGSIPGVTAANTNPVLATVTYTDTNEGQTIAASSITAANITVNKGADTLTATVVGTPQNNATLPVQYSIAAPTGGWSTTHNGTWNITLATNSVRNSLDIAVPGGLLGSFTVNIAPVVIPDPDPTPDPDPIPIVTPENSIYKDTPYPLECAMGEDKAFLLYMRQLDGTPYDLTDCEITSQVRSRANTVIATLEATAVDNAEGLLRLRINSAANTRSGKFYYDVKIKNALGMIDYLPISTFTVFSVATRPTPPTPPTVAYLLLNNGGYLLQNNAGTIQI